MSGNDSWIDEEIQRQLDQLDTDTDTELSEAESTTQDVSENSVKASTEGAIVLDLVNCVSKFALDIEKNLAECDDLLQEAVLVSARSRGISDPTLQAEAEKSGVDIETLKQSILRDLMKSSQSTSATAQDTGQCEAESSVEVADTSIAVEKELDHQVEELEQKHQLLELEWTHNEENWRMKESKKSEELEIKWQMKREQLKEDERLASIDKQMKEKKMIAEQSEIQKSVNETLSQFQVNIDKLAEQIKLEREQFEKVQEENSRWQHNRLSKAAISIQTAFRGFRVRKRYGGELKKKIETFRELQKQQILRLEEEKRKKEEDEKRILEDQQRKREEEQRKKVAEEERLFKEKKRLEEERLKKSLEAQKMKEEEEAKKLAEQRLKEEKKRKVEEEQRRKEDDKRRKAEEEKQKEEQRKEEDRQLEESKRKAEEEETRKKEQEEKNKVIEKKKREEQQKLHEKKRAQKKQQVQEADAVESFKTVQIDENLNEGNSTQTTEGNNTHASDETKDLASEDANTQSGLQKVGEIDVTSSSASLGLNNKERMVSSPGNSFVLQDNSEQVVSLHGPQLVELEGPELSVISDSTNRRLQNETKGNLVEESIEKRRLDWMKEAQSKGKLSEKSPQGSKLSQKVPRRPASVKQLAPLEDKLITMLAHVSTLQQVTTLELHDLPGCDVATLSRCVNLRTLRVTGCGVVAVDSLNRLPYLQYVDFTNNKIEMMDFTDAPSLMYLDMSHNRLPSVHGLNGCTALRHLNLSHNKIARIGGLESLSALHTLLLSHNLLLTAKLLCECSSIQVLDVSHNHLPLLDAIEELSFLEHLDCRDNNFESVPVLTNQVLLSDLLLDGNSITSLSALQCSWLPSLYHLSVKQNNMSAVADLRFCACLQSIDLRNNQITDISSLSSCVTLQSLRLNENPIVEESNYRTLVSSCLRCLQLLDDEPVYGRELLTVLCNNTWRATCLKQVNDRRQLRNNYLDSLRRIEPAGFKNVDELLQLHKEYFDESRNLAIEHRYMHEHGTKGPPRPKPEPSHGCTPQNGSALADVRRSQTSNSGHVNSTVSTVDARSKFEQALQDATATVKTKPRVSVTANHVAGVKPESPVTDPKSKFEQALVNATAVVKTKPNVSIVNDVLDARAKFEQALLGAASAVKSRSDASIADEFEESAKKRSAMKSIENGPELNVAESFGGTTYNETLKKVADTQRNAHNTQVLRIVPETGAFKSPVKSAWMSTTPRFKVDSAKLHQAATVIQALWRGHRLRRRLQYALNFEQISSNLLNVDVQDFDLANFVMFDAELCSDWTVPETPHHRNIDGVNALNTSGRITATNNEFNGIGRRLAWHNPQSPIPNGSSRDHRSPFPTGKPPLPPVQVNPEMTHRTASDKKENELLEEWGFKNERTAELLRQRARRLENGSSPKKKKLNQLDPQQRLAVFRRLEEISRINPLPMKHQTVRQDYFQAMAQHREEQSRAESVERHQKANYTYEWIHTQVRHGNSPVPDIPRCVMDVLKLPFSIFYYITVQNFTRNRSSAKTYGNLSMKRGISEGSLPKIDSTLMSGIRSHHSLASPVSLEIESVDSASLTGGSVSNSHRRRLSLNNRKLPPLIPTKTTAEPVNSSNNNEKMSWRNTLIDKSTGWGGGKKRSGHK